MNSAPSPDDISMLIDSIPKSLNFIRMIDLFGWTVRWCAVLCVCFLNDSGFAAAQNISSVTETASGNADETGGVTVSRLRLGLGGLGRVGCWMPIRIEVTGLPASGDIRFVVVAADARGDQCEDTVASLVADSSGNATVSSVFMTGRLDGNITVRILAADDQILWEHTLKCRALEGVADFSLPESPVEIPALQSELKTLRCGPVSFATVGIPEGLAALTNGLAADEATREALVIMSVESIADLPDSRRGLDGVDFLYLVDGYELSESQQHAVEEWVTTGGHFIVSCGAELPKLLQSTTGRWLQPIMEIEPTLFYSQDLSALQNFVPGSSQLQTYRNSVPVMKLRSDEAWSVVNSINGPLMQRVSFGGGLITVLAVDLNRKPVSQWLSLPQLYESLIFARQLDKAEGRVTRGGRISSTGVSDLATQLATVWDAVPATDRWSTWSVMLLMLVFLIVIGPLDYLLVTRLLKKPHLTWLTFPILIAAFCLLAVKWVGTRESPLVVRQVHLLDVAQPGAKQTVRIRSWGSISAADSGYISVTSKQLPIRSVSTESDLNAVQPTLTWHGRPEDVYGGLYREGGVTLGRQISHRSEKLADAASGFSSTPMLCDGSSAFLAESLTDVSASPIVESSLRVPGNGLLEGEFTHRLAAPIRNWVVVFANRVYRPSVKASADAWVIEPEKAWSRENNSVSVSDLREFLKGVRVPEPTPKSTSFAKSQQIQIKSYYDTQGTNPLDILMTVSLYDVTGEAFVRLQNNALRRDEVSDALYLNTALVMGTVDLPLSEMIVNGTAVVPVESQTVVRFLLPVVRSDTGERPQMAEPPGGSQPN
ncbi:MAG TPA: hypothetical protein PLY87_09865 [Planctomycetaceae bacterium]|nr:hypothetical protein [Planctomycetaceae bacterium]HQZ65372.1 hypothetical protein [Planctomycetaceae bacterium]